MLACVEDYRALARRRLPKLVFDYLDLGAEGNEGVDRNRAALDRLTFVPRVLRDVSTIDASVDMLGRRSRYPFAVGPTGLNGLYAPRAEESLARAAHAAGVPFVLSTASNSLLESVRAATDGPLWLQLYVHDDRRIAEDLMRRAWGSGYDVLLLTIDVPVHGKRDHDIRNGFRTPLRISPALAVDLALHPRWCLRMLRQGGAPQFVNVARSSGVAARLAHQVASLGRQLDKRLDWGDIGWLREHWHGKLVLKGILSVADALLARDAGVDGIVLSNHGGRQLAGLPSAIEVLPHVVSAVGERLEVLVDGGVRRGSDIAKALALGARGVLLGRAPLYGLSASGEAGATEVVRLICDEFEITLRLLGCKISTELETAYLSVDPARR